MIWQQPIAWIGLIALSVPVIIHLLGRGDSRSIPFPSLRFIQRTRLLPTRRTTLRDRLLLAVRLLILAAAVAALAQPLWSTLERTRAFAGSLSRAVVVDTNAGEAGRNTSSLALAQRLADSASIHVLIPTASPAQALAGAVSWLAQQPGRAELVIVSHFAAGELTTEQLSSIPREIGVRVVRTAVPPASTTTSTTTSGATLGDIAVDVRSTFNGAPASWESSETPVNTSATWTSRPDAVHNDSLAVTAVGDASEQSALALALGAARRSTAMPIDSLRSASNVPDGVTVVTPSAPNRAALVQSSIPLRTPWMLLAVAQLHASALLRAAAATAVPVERRDSVTGTIVIADRHGAALVEAREGIVDGQHRLLLLTQMAAADFSTAALIAAVRETQASRRRIEREPSLLPDSTLRAWQRPPSADRRTSASSGQFDTDQGPSDARWIWLAVLVLIGAEQLLRRGARTATEPG